MHADISQGRLTLEGQRHRLVLEQSALERRKRCNRFEVALPAAVDDLVSQRPTAGVLDDQIEEGLGLAQGEVYAGEVHGAGRRIGGVARLRAARLKGASVAAVRWPCVLKLI